MKDETADISDHQETLPIRSIAGEAESTGCVLSIVALPALSHIYIYIYIYIYTHIVIIIIIIINDHNMCIYIYIYTYNLSLSIYIYIYNTPTYAIV